MLKRLKTVSMMLFLMGTSTGAAFAISTPGADDVKITQQSETATGVVKDMLGETVIGASVIVKGTTNGTITDFDGNFSLPNVKKGDIIQISFVGYQTQEIAWNGTPLNVTLSDDTQALEEVVVTALGMKREKKALGYAVTEMKGEDLNANVVNPVSALQGKVAGVEINQSDGGLFGSNKILIRGASTLGKNNQPIYVVDGIILDNSINEGSADWDSNSNDWGNELKNLNPDDFETVSVLKGAAATALYGSRGLNGAVVITTKSGKGKKGLGINFSQTLGLDVMTGQPDFQNVYGPGYLPGFIDWANPFDSYNAWYKNSEGVNSLIPLDGYYGYGPAFDGSMVEYYDGSMVPYVAQKNNYKDSYDTGFNTNTNVAISGGNETTNFYTSLSYKHANSTTPNTSFDRFSFMAKASHKITDKVLLEAGITFANSTPKNPEKNIGENFISGTWSRAYDAKAGRERYKGEHGGLAQSQYGDQWGNMPGRDTWWSLFENEYFRKETTVRPNLKLSWDLTDWLKFSAEGSYNYYYVRYEEKQPGSGYANEGGYYGMGNTTKEQTNLNANFHANKQLNDDFEVHGFVRGEYFNSFSQGLSMGTSGGLVVPNQYFINNSKNAINYSGSVSGEKTMMSVVGQVGASWKNQIYLDVTGRNDWSSSLVYGDGHGTFSYFYPSVSGSWLIHETFRDKMPSWISFAKVRASWAQVGNDTEPYLINSAYALNTSTTLGGNKVYNLRMDPKSYDYNLKPERKSSWEVGLDLRFLENRINLDATYYKENTRDQIMTIKVPSVSGLNEQLVNAGDIQNQGFEIALNTTPIENKDWTWDLNFTWTKNISKIVSLHENVADYIGLMGDVTYGNYRVGSVAKVGGAYGLLLTDSGKRIDEVSGLPVIGYQASARGAYYSRSGEITELGSIQPDFLGSVSTTLRYKNWRLGVSLDARFGGYVASYGSHYGTAYGFLKESLKGSPVGGGKQWTSKWDNVTYYDGVIPEGILLKGTAIPQPDGSTYTVGTGAYSSGETYAELIASGHIEPTHAPYWTYRNNQWVNASLDRGVVNDSWFTELNYIALRDVNLTYTFPSNIAGKIGAKNLSLTAAAHNLGYLLNSMPNGENPEAVRGTSAAEFRLRSFNGVTTNFTFTINATF